MLSRDGGSPQSCRKSLFPSPTEAIASRLPLRPCEVRVELRTTD